jgi:putative peptidoglycan lipid II flippase
LSRIAATSIIISGITLVNLALLFFSTLVIAWKFGSGYNMDSFFAGITIPLFIVSIISGSLSFSFIPIFSKYKDSGEVWVIANSFLNIVIITSIVFCLFGFMYADQIIDITNPGFDQKQVALTSHILQIALPLIVFSSINELMASVFYAHGYFFLPAVNKLINPSLIIGIIYFFGDDFGIDSLAYAMLVSSLTQTIFLFVNYSRNKKFHYKFETKLNNKGVRNIINLMLPLVAGMFVYRAMPIYDKIFLSYLSAGSISYITYSQKLLHSIPAIVSTGIAVTTFPLMSEYFVNNKIKELRVIVSKAIRVIFFVTVPLMVFLFNFGEGFIVLMFEHGAFESDDTIGVYRAFAIYVIALPAMTAGAIIGQSYYAMHDTITASIIGVVEVCFYIIFCYSMIPYFGYLTIPVGFVLYHYMGLVVNGFIIRRKMKSLGGKGVIKSFAVCLFISLLSLSMIIALQQLTHYDGDILYFIFSILIYIFISNNIVKTEEARMYVDKFKGLMNAKKILNK